ncbi:MAG: TrmB family transcriptional regulator [Candidatus Methanodesulfokora sp.]|mgnify:CR=1 FL=1
MQYREMRSFEVLRKAGLSGQEAVIYLSLLLKGDMPARRICEETGIPYPKVYVNLSKLERDGWVSQIKGRPVIYRAKPIEEVAGMIVERAKKLAEELERTVLSDIEEMRIRFATTSRISFSYSRNEALRAIRYLIKEAKKEILIFLSHEDEDLLNSILPAKARTRVLTTRRNIDILRKRIPEAEFKEINILLPLSLITFDNSSLLMIFGVSTGPYALEVRDRDLVATAREYLRMSWEST